MERGVGTNCGRKVHCSKLFAEATSDPNYQKQNLPGQTNETARQDPGGHADVVNGPFWPHL